MYLRTFGGLTLEESDFTRPKPLLLLAYLVLEGPVDRRRVAELFWPAASDHMKSLTVALSRIRKGAPGAVGADHDRAWAEVASDAPQFLDRLDRNRGTDALELYRGPFLAGFYLPHWGAELEEWVYRTRETLAAHARRALLDAAHREAAHGSFEAAARLAERALEMVEAAPEPDDLLQMHTLLLAGGSPLSRHARQQADTFDLDVCERAAEARERLRLEPAAADAAAGATRSGVGPTNLPVRGASFVGRARELGEIDALLAEHALVTLVGVGGVGKSSLATAVGRRQRESGRFPDGVYRVSLETLTDPDEIPHAIATASGIQEVAMHATPSELAERIAGREILWILDGFEHLIEGSALLSDLLESAPGARILVTSRERLNLSVERVYPVEGLAFPDEATAVADALEFDAVALYAERARRSNPDFVLDESTLPAVVATCRLVHGLPLGIELAASWLRVLPPHEIAAEIERSLDFLVARHRDVPERHRSLENAFEHSWRLLRPDERKVLRMLAVCRGGFRRRAATEIAGATIAQLASLAEKSLLRVGASGRYDRHPLLYHYTIEKLEAHPAERAEAARRHASSYLALLSRLEDDLVGAGQSEAVETIAEELDNVHAAWRWAAEHEDIEALQRACRPLQLFYIQRGGMSRVGAREFAAAASRLDRDEARHKPALGRLRAAEAWFRFRLGERDHAKDVALEAIELLTPVLADEGHLEAGEESELEVERAVRAMASARNTLGNIAKREGELGLAEEHFGAAMDLARRSGNRPQVAILTNNLAMVAKDRGDYDRAERLYREAIALNRILGNHRSAVRNLTNLGATYVFSGEPERAERTLIEGLELAESIGYDAIAPNILMNLGGAAFVAGGYDHAERRFRKALGHEHARPDPAFAAGIHSALGRVATARDELPAARRAFRAALETAGECRDVGAMLEAMLGLGELYLKRETPCRAARFLALLPEVVPLPAHSAQCLRRLVEEARSSGCPEMEERPRHASESGRTDGDGRVTRADDGDMAAAIMAALAEALRQAAAP